MSLELDGIYCPNCGSSCNYPDKEDCVWSVCCNDCGFEIEIYPEDDREDVEEVEYEYREW